MVILGAKGHALEIMDVLLYNNPAENFCFFDNISTQIENTCVKKYHILRSKEELAAYFKKNKNFIIGSGNPYVRKKLVDIAVESGGTLTSVISKTAYLSNLNVTLGKGINLMHQAAIHPEVNIGEGTLINCKAIIHHESKIGAYCEICPGTIITGNVTIGDYVMIGTGTIILPGITIGNNAIIGAGSVVKNNIPDNTLVAGVPAMIKKYDINKHN